MSEDKLNNHLTSESYLSLRKPSNEDDENFISGISSSYQAAKLRSASSNKSIENFHSPVNFSWKSFWKTFIYENLPPVIFSPLATLLLESSLSRAWHVSQNRMLIAVSTKHHSLKDIIQMWLVVYPGSWLMNVGLYLALFSDNELIQNIDPFHIILAYLMLFMRRLIIATKYGYFRPEDTERLCLPAPDWDRNKTNRRLVGQGWLQPWLYPGIIEDELTIAMDENDICLQGIPIELEEDSASDVSAQKSSSLFPPKTSATKLREIASGFLLFNIIKSIYDKPTFIYLRLLIVICILSITVTPFLAKFLTDIVLFGVTAQEKIISSATLIGFFNGFQIMMFGLVCAVDYERRYQTSKKLGEMVSYPGTIIQSVFDSANKASNVYIDLQKRVNVFGWMNMRKVLRSFGETFFLRIQSYTSILIAYSLFCVAILNLIIWTEMRHHISTIAVIVVITALISSICLFAIFKAIRLQSLSAQHRDFVRNQIFIIEEEIWELKLNGSDQEKINDLQSAKSLLEQVDESINYRELIYKPATILGYAANNGVIGSVLGIVLTGCLFAVQGFVSTGIEYDINGWFGP
ncbi:hypothetical protein M9C80_04350 [SAR86 cluster bacterium]|jgi:hypothetical protein|nr:hypothetical protein M9C80_04350 [SAR86 cluster bacterium]|tara:strand:+ start:6651 stop:8381 length:1731 start_codon:yes stop_codon:yes gene_type:complete